MLKKIYILMNQLSLTQSNSNLNWTGLSWMGLSSTWYFKFYTFYDKFSYNLVSNNSKHIYYIPQRSQNKNVLLWLVYSFLSQIRLFLFIHCWLLTTLWNFGGTLVSFGHSHSPIKFFLVPKQINIFNVALLPVSATQPPPLCPTPWFKN